MEILTEAHRNTVKKLDDNKWNQLIEKTVCRILNYERKNSHIICNGLSEYLLIFALELQRVQQYQ